MRVNLMIEGQEDVTWEQWVALAPACEEDGLDGLFRSDHYFTVQGHPPAGALDAWATVTALAARDRPAPAGHAGVAGDVPAPVGAGQDRSVTADHISGGRVELGMGAGWLEAEHRAYGFPFPPAGDRMDMLAEQVEIVQRSVGPTGAGRRSPATTTAWRAATRSPSRCRTASPELIMAAAVGRTAVVALAARWADEYNTVNSVTPDQCCRARSGCGSRRGSGGAGPGDASCCR